MFAVRGESEPRGMSKLLLGHKLQGRLRDRDRELQACLLQHNLAGGRHLVGHRHRNPQSLRSRPLPRQELQAMTTNIKYHRFKLC